MRSAKTLIRLGGCPGWSESSLGAHATLLVLSWGGSINVLYGSNFFCLLPRVVYTYFINFLNQSQLTTLLSSLIARQRVGPQTYWWLRPLTLNEVGLVLMICLWSGHRGSTVWFLLLQRFSVGLAVEYSACFISYVCCTDSLMSYTVEVLHAD